MRLTPGNYTILIADKSRDVRDVMYDILREAGHNCILAADGLEAMQRFRHARPRLVIVGARLQIIGGVEMIKHVRLKDPDTAVIAMSGEWGVDRRDCYRLGADKVLTKPVSVDEVLFYVERALERRELLIERRLRSAPASA